MNCTPPFGFLDMATKCSDVENIAVLDDDDVAAAGPSTKVRSRFAAWYRKGLAMATPPAANE